MVGGSASRAPRAGVQGHISLSTAAAREPETLRCLVWL